MAVSRRLRFEILRRDAYSCRYCGSKAPDVSLTVDHVVPVALGGGDEPSNLVTACTPCNAGKPAVQPDSPLVEDVDAAALLFARAIERASELRRVLLENIDSSVDYFDECWGVWFVTATKEPIPRDDAWRASIERFLTNGL